ncbi:MAG: tRNA (N6-isopentenyl adenosine(37)-C2)-methylthiotransferase MiaB [Bacteroidota bacterium]|nr:tRNA (N6-isopentenyl adenosine(37)-C2)-methylthiotransferase MiaB [Bacteroidota bacterium]
MEEKTKKLYIETYGCAMNVSDSEIVASVMVDNGFTNVDSELDADVVFINTCAIRDGAEQKIWTRLHALKSLRKKRPGMIVGVLGCMAERLKDKLLEVDKLVDVVAGPDAYRDLPNLIRQVEEGSKAMNVMLSLEETYSEITPVRINSNGVSAFISIMRGCDNMCSFCVVPFTRGRERSRDPYSIVEEAKQLLAEGIKEVTLLGQNVDSYLWFGGGPKKEFVKLSDEEKEEAITFDKLLGMVADLSPELRVRFSTSHPKDITDAVIYKMIEYENICNYIHLPVQSGSSRVLDLMNRIYTREWYMDKVLRIRELIPECGITTDIISGFCTETEEDHHETMSILEWGQFDFAFMYAYSERPGTLAARKYADDVPDEVKSRRLAEIVKFQNRISTEKHEQFIGQTCKVLVEGFSKKSDNDLKGRNDQNVIVIFPKEHYKPGDYVNVKIHKATTTSLIGTAI